MPLYLLSPVSRKSSGGRGLGGGIGLGHVRFERKNYTVSGTVPIRPRNIPNSNPQGANLRHNPTPKP